MRRGALAKSISNWHLIGYNEGYCSNNVYILLPCFYGIRFWIWPEPLVAPRVRRALGTRMTINMTRGPNLVPRACDPWEGNEGSGIIRCRKPGILAKIELRIHFNGQSDSSLKRIIPEPSFPSQGSQARGTRLTRTEEEEILFRVPNVVSLDSWKKPSSYGSPNEA